MSLVLQRRIHAESHSATISERRNKRSSEFGALRFILGGFRWTPLGLAPLTLILFLVFAAFPAQGATCPVFSEPGWAPSCTSQNGCGVAPAEVKVTYGNCPLAPSTATLITASGFPSYLGTWEIVALGYNGVSCAPIPMPDWISFTPASGPEFRDVKTIKMTIDPTKGGGTAILGWFLNGRLGFLVGEWYDQNGADFAAFWDDGNQQCGLSTFYVITDTPPVSPRSTSLDLGPSCPRSGAENMCGSPINLTNGNTYVQADDYELPARWRDFSQAHLEQRMAQQFTLDSGRNVRR